MIASSVKDVQEILEEYGIKTEVVGRTILVFPQKVEEFRLRFPDTFIAQTKYYRVYLHPESIMVITSYAVIPIKLEKLAILEAEEKNNALYVYFTLL